MQIDKPSIKVELEELEKRLVNAFDKFREAYFKYGDKRNLSNQEVYEMLTTELKSYNNEVDGVQKETIQLMVQIQKDQDNEKYIELLKKLGIQPKDA